MSKSSKLIATILAALFASALLAGCERRGRETPSKTAAPDPRVAKNFDPSTPWFCAIPYEYSKSDDGESDRVENGLVVATGENRETTYASLKKECSVAETEAEDAEDAEPAPGASPDSAPPSPKPSTPDALADTPPKLQCRAILAAKQEKCVGAAMFAPMMPVTGLWRCEMKFSVDGAERTLEETGHTTAKAAVAAAFKRCADLKDPCAKAMMDRKMSCSNLNAGVSEPPKPANRRRLARAPKKK